MSIVLNPFLSTDFFADEDWPYNMLGTARADRGQDVGGGTRQRGDRKQGVWRPRMDWQVARLWRLIRSLALADSRMLLYIY